MSPILVGLGAFALGMFASSSLEEARKKKIAEDLARQQVFDLSAKELQQGRTYAVTLEIDPTNPQFGGIRDLARAQALIKATMQAPGGPGGWRLLGEAAPIDQQNLQLFLSGRPAQWAFTGVWTRPEKFVAEKPGWITMAVPFLLPTA